MTDTVDSFNKIVELILTSTKQKLSCCLMLKFGDVFIAIRSNSSALIDTLSIYYEGFIWSEPANPDIYVSVLDQPPPDLECSFIQKQPDPGKTKIKEEYIDFPEGRIVRKCLTGMLFAFGGNINIATGNCLENANQVINFANNRYIQLMLNRGYLLGHAAAVSVNGTGIAMAGFAGAGKSTLCLHLMKKGALLISNDRLLVKKESCNLRISGVAKLPRVNPGTVLNNPCLNTVMPAEQRLVFEKMSQDDIWHLEHKYDVFINSVFGKGKFCLLGTLDILVILNWKRNNGLFELKEVDIAKRIDLLKAFIKSPGLFYEPHCSIDTEKVFSSASYIDHLKHCRVFEISGGVDFDRAAGVCMQLAETGKKQ